MIGKAKGKRQSLLVLTERMTRYEVILRVPNKTSSATVRALDKMLKKFPENTLSSGASSPRASPCAKLRRQTATMLLPR